MTRNPTAADPPLVAGPAAGGAVADVCAQAMPNVITVHPLKGRDRQQPRALRTLVNGKVAASLGRLHVPATTARVQVANETGAKGGPTARCSITVDLPRRPELHADITAESSRLAFDARDRARREERRRPKKYYLAKRLLEPGASSGESPARPAVGRRLARRRTA